MGKLRKIVNPLIEIEEQVKDFVSKKDWLIKVIQLCVIILFPILEAIILQFKDSLSTSWLWLVLLAPLALIHLTLGIVILTLPLTIEKFYFDYKELDELSDTLLDEMLQNSYIARAINLSLISLIEFIDQTKEHDEISIEEITENVSNILSPIINLREYTFNFKLASYHNFAVYLISNEDGGILKLFYRSVDDRIERHDRSWKPGQGHVGICYANAQIMICMDTLNSSELSGTLIDSDRDYYRSMASTPIFKKLASKEVRGVFVVTSSLPDQFNQEVHDPLLSIISTILSIYFNYVDKKYKGGDYCVQG